MGVDVDPEFIIGQDFENISAVEDWFQEKFPEKYAKYLLSYDGDINEFAEREFKLRCIDVTAYDECGYVLGYDVYDVVGDESGETLKETWRQAREMFGEGARRHYWARYW